MTSLSLVLPCYNEAGGLPALLERLREVFGPRPDTEVVLVDNGSTDGTAALLAGAAKRADLPFLRLARVEVNQGYGFGILTGLRVACGEILAWSHGDLQTDPADVLAAYDLMARQPDPRRAFVKGRRVGRSLFDAVFTFGMSVLSSVLLRQRLSDINAQPKVFHRAFFEALLDPPHDFSLDLFALYEARRRGLQVLEQPVRFEARRHGQAKGGGTLRGKWRLTRRTWAYMLELRRRLRKEGRKAEPRGSGSE